MKNVKFLQLFKDFKMKKAEEIYSKAEFNFNLLKVSIDKVHDIKTSEKENTKKLMDDIYKKDSKFGFRINQVLTSLALIVIIASSLILIYHYKILSKKIYIK